MISHNFRRMGLAAVLLLQMLSACNILRDRMPMEELIYPPIDAVGKEEVAEPAVVGGVLIANGASTLGGYADDEISIAVTYAASSTAGEVTDMRIARTRDEEAIREAEWEPFVDKKTYKITLMLNFYGLIECVQYRDELGNLSPVYCDDVNVEGMAKPPDVD